MCDQCQVIATAYEDKLNRAMADIAGLERDLKGKRLTIARLEAEIAAKDETHKRTGDAKEVFDFWREQLAPKAREFKGKRRKAVLDRLDAGRTVDELKQAILGCKAFPTTDSNGVAYSELELICRSDEKVLLNLKRYEAWKQATDAQDAREEMGPGGYARLDRGLRAVGKWVRKTGGTTYADRMYPNRTWELDHPVDGVLSRLEGCGCDWNNIAPHKWMAQCPAHNDGRPSLSITDWPDRADLEPGTVLLHCFAGCTTQDICAALGIEIVDLFPGRRVLP